MQIRPMTIEDYDEVYAMWQITSKRALSSSDSREKIGNYLKRNPDMSQVAVCDGKIVGTVLAGHDGRTGFIHHTAVHPDYRRRHIGKAMVEMAIKYITESGINKTQIYCYIDNTTGQNFWKSLGFNRTENVLFETTQD